MKVFTYYEPITRSDIWNPEDQSKLLDLWKKSWSKHGWDPVVLTREDSKRHPRYAEFEKKFFGTATLYGADFDGPCKIRYAAVAAQREPLAMMTDYDVMNYGLSPEDALALSTKTGSPRLIFFSRLTTANCGMVLGPWELFEGMSQIFFAWEPDERDHRKVPGFDGHDCTENNLLLRMKKQTYPKPEWVQWEPGNIVWSKPGWESATTVHYGFEMKLAGHWPKWQHIEKIRPL